MAVWEPDIVCRKSSSISRTFASRDLEERSFSSSSFMRLLSSIVFRVILRPGRPIRKIQGSHCRKTDLIWEKLTVRREGVEDWSWFGQCLVCDSPTGAFRGYPPCDGDSWAPQQSAPPTMRPWTWCSWNRCLGCSVGGWIGSVVDWLSGSDREKAEKSSILEWWSRVLRSHRNTNNQSSKS